MSRQFTAANARALSGCGRQPYPHLSPLDASVWALFLKSNPFRSVNIWYDVRLGVLSCPAEYSGTEDGAMWEALVKKRVDVVVETSDAFWIVELKGIGGMSALGQLITYRRMLLEEWKPAKPISAVLVCALADVDVVASFRSHGVRVVETGWPDDSPVSRSALRDRAE